MKKFKTINIKPVSKFESAAFVIFLYYFSKQKLRIRWRWLSVEQDPMSPLMVSKHNLFQLISPCYFFFKILFTCISLLRRNGNTTEQSPETWKTSIIRSKDSNFPCRHQLPPVNNQSQGWVYELSIKNLSLVLSWVI